MAGSVNCLRCHGGLEACAHLGKIPVYAVCVLCGESYMVRVFNGEIIVLENPRAKEKI